MSFHRVVAEMPLITLTLWLQSAGVAALVTWVRRVLGAVEGGEDFGGPGVDGSACAQYVSG